jgi:glutamine cyclotransferase
MPEYYKKMKIKINIGIRIKNSRNMKLLFFFVYFILINSHSYSDRAKAINETNDYKVINVSHKKNAILTHGLLISKDGKYLYESGGFYMKSSIRKISYPSLKILFEKKLSNNYYGEGIAICENILYQLTWREEIVLIYDPDNLEFLGTIDLDENMREGVGLTEYSDNLLIATDGSSEIFFLKCRDNLKMEKKIHITENDFALSRLGDIVFVDGYLYANRYFDNYIYKINIENGKVEKKWDMIKLMENEIRMGGLNEVDYGHGNFLNGMTYDKNRNLFILTGKNWGFFYEIELY